MIPKYRAWRKSDKILLPVRDIIWHRNEISRVVVLKGNLLLTNVFENVILMQSTGLFDKNGQEIFEGDLLDTSDPTGNIISSGNPILEVCFDGLEFTVKGDIEGGEMSLREFKEICELAGIPLKVIGNVYENRDLLENL